MDGGWKPSLGSSVTSQQLWSGTCKLQSQASRYLQVRERQDWKAGQGQPFRFPLSPGHSSPSLHSRKGKAVSEPSHASSWLSLPREQFVQSWFPKFLSALCPPYPSGHLLASLPLAPTLGKYIVGKCLQLAKISVQTLTKVASRCILSLPSDPPH